MSRLRLIILIFALVLTASTAAPAAALDMRGDTIYMIMVDRFFDGDPANNTVINPYQYSPDHSEWGKYFGGDIAGITQKLDYLKTIGATALWLTPLYQNAPFQLGSGAPYHGYDMNDVFRVEPHFGNWTTFDTLTDAMHSRGMKVILDVNVNNASVTSCGSLCKVYRDGVLKGDYFRDFNNWFHHYGTLPDDKWEDQWWVLNGDIFGLADLNQDNPDVRRYFLTGISRWMYHGVDGFRVDAAKHAPLDWMRQFSDEMNRFAGWLGRPGTYSFGEYYGGGAYNGASVDWSHQANMALFDFSLASDIRDVELENISFWQLWNNISYRQSAYGTDGQGGPNSNWQVIWFDSQDWQRLITVLLQKYGGNELAAKNRVDQAIVLTETLPGIPCIYYGTEQYLHNDSPGTGGVSGADPYNRPMMTSWDTTTNATRTLAALSGIRKANPALQYGDIQQRYVTSSLFVYSRQWDTSAVVVALNNSGVAQDVDVSSLPLPDGSYEDMLHRGTWINLAGGRAHLHLDPTSSIVLVRGATSLSAITPAHAQPAYIATSATLRPMDATPLAIDGRNIPSDFAGHLTATQDNFTWFGDAGHPSGGSEMDQLFVNNDASSLQIGITGNLENNRNSWLVFLQTAPEGTSTLTATAGPPSGIVGSMRGTMMDDGFAPDWLLMMNADGTKLYVDLVDLVNNTTRYLGSVTINSGNGILSGGINPSGAQVAFDNTNIAGVTSDPSRSASQNQADAATATTGAEIVLPFSDIQLAAGKVRVFAMIVGSGAYISNQALPGFGGRFYNLGTPPVDFDRIPTTQYAEVALGGLSFAPQDSVVAAKSKPVGSAVSLSSQVVVGSYPAFSCYYIESTDRISGIRVRDTSGSLPSPGKVVDIQGFLTTDSGERVINASSTIIRNMASIPRSLGTSNLNINECIGVLVTAWGKVTDKGTDELGNDFFYIDDGSGIWDGSYNGSGGKRLGVRVVTSYSYPNTGTFLRVTGVSGVQMINGTPQRRILPRSAMDVRTVAQ